MVPLAIVRMGFTKDAIKSLPHYALKDLTCKICILRMGTCEYIIPKEKEGT